MRKLAFFIAILVIASSGIVHALITEENQAGSLTGLMVYQTSGGSSMIAENVGEQQGEAFVPDSYIVGLIEPSMLEVSGELIEEIEELAKKKAALDAETARNPLNFLAGIESYFMSNDLNSKTMEMERAVDEQSAQLDSIIEKARSDFLDIGGTALTIEEEYKTAFSGMAIKASENEINEIKKLSYVKEIYPNAVVHAELMDSVSLIGANQVWQIRDSQGNQITGKGIKIGIIDTGVDYFHPDLGGCFGAGCKVVGGYDFYNKDSDPMDDHGHGTHCAAVAAGKGVLNGIAPEATIYAYKVLNGQGYGYTDDIIAAIERAADPNQDGDFSDHLDVISLSLGGYGDPDDPSSQAIDAVTAAGVIAVVAAGNSGPSLRTIDSPGVAREAITVGAVYKKNYDGQYWDLNPRADQITVFSSRGPVKWLDENGKENIINKPDVVAPGAIICAARYDSLFPVGQNKYYYPCVDEKHVQLAGTSMATPIVAGAAALIKQAHPDWNPQKIKAALKDTAKPLGNNIFAYGAGRVDVSKAIQYRFNGDDVTKMESPGSVRSSFGIKGVMKTEGFQKYKIEIGKLGRTGEVSSLAEAYSSYSLPADDYLARNLELPNSMGSHIIKLTVYFNSGEPTVRYAYLYNMNGDNIKIMDGWPQGKIDLFQYGSTPIIYDVDGDGNKEIITNSNDRVAVWRPDGSYLPGWPKTIDMGDASGGALEPPSAGDVNGDGSPEIVMVPSSIIYSNFVKDGINYPKPCIYVWKANGQDAQGWENSCLLPSDSTDVGGTQGGTLYDIDNDGKLEIITLMTDGYAWYLWSFKGDGSVSPGFPIKAADCYMPFPLNPRLKVIYSTVTMPSAGDVDGDGQPEIVVVAQNYNYKDYKDTSVKIFSGSGIVEKEFAGLEYAGGGQGLLLVDLDGDGKKEISYVASSGLTSMVFYKYDGTRYDWTFKNYDQYMNMIASDIMKDNSIDIITSFYGSSSTGVTAFDNKGKMLEGWPQKTEGIPLWVRQQTADINYDGFPEILTTTSSGMVYAWDRKGNVIEGFPIEMAGTSESGIAVDDIDGDGKLELVAGTQDGTIYVWKLMNSRYDGQQLQWPMWKHDAQNTGIFEPGKITNTCGLMPCDAATACGATCNIDGPVKYCRSLDGGAYRWLTMTQLPACNICGSHYAECEGMKFTCRQMEPGGWDWYRDSDIDLVTDPNNCGSFCNVCESDVCENGACTESLCNQVACNSGTSCDDTCNLDGPLKRCMSLNGGQYKWLTAAQVPACDSSKCGSTAACGGLSLSCANKGGTWQYWQANDIDLNSDPNNCGSLCNACKSGTCNDGACFHDCTYEIPKLVGSKDLVADSTSIYALGARGNYVYLASREKGLLVADVTNPKKIQLAYQISNEDMNIPASFYTRMSASKNYLYVYEPTAGMRILDISTPDKPAMAGSMGKLSDTNYDGDIYASDSYVYISGYLSSQGGMLWILDASDPANPKVVSSNKMSISINRIFISGSYLYLTSDRGFQIYDVSDASRPKLVGSLDDRLGGIQSLFDAESLYVSGKYAYLSANGGLNGPWGTVSPYIRIVDISNPESPRLAGTITTDLGNKVDVKSAGNYVYHVNGGYLSAYDISDPANPILKKRLSGSIGVNLLLSNNYAYTNMGGTGLYIYEIASCINTEGISALESELGECSPSIQCIQNIGEISYYCSMINGTWKWRSFDEVGQFKCSEVWGACTRFEWQPGCQYEGTGECYALDDTFHYNTQELCDDKTTVLKSGGGCAASGKRAVSCYEGGEGGAVNLQSIVEYFRQLDVQLSILEGESYFLCEENQGACLTMEKLQDARKSVSDHIIWLGSQNQNIEFAIQRSESLKQEIINLLEAIT